MPESESPHETVEETEERRVEQEMEVEEEPLELVTRKREPGKMMQHSSQPCEQCSANTLMTPDAASTVTLMCNKLDMVVF